MMSELAMAERSYKRGIRNVTEAQDNYVASCKRYGGNRLLWEKLAHAEKVYAQRRHRYFTLLPKPAWHVSSPLPPSEQKQGRSAH